MKRNNLYYFQDFIETSIIYIVDIMKGLDSMKILEIPTDGNGPQIYITSIRSFKNGFGKNYILMDNVRLETSKVTLGTIEMKYPEYFI